MTARFAERFYYTCAFRVIGAQQDEGKAFVVAQQHIVRRAIALDQLRFEQQRLGFARRRDDLHRARLRHHALQPLRQPCYLRVIGHPVLERPRLSHIKHITARIEHAIDARARRQFAHDTADRFGAARQVGLVIRLAATADNVGRLLFVKSVGSVWASHDFACRRW